MLLVYEAAPTDGNCAELTDINGWTPVDEIGNGTPISYNPYGDLASADSIGTSGSDPTDTSPHTYTDTYEDYYQTYRVPDRMMLPMPRIH